MMTLTTTKHDAFADALCDAIAHDNHRGVCGNWVALHQGDEVAIFEAGRHYATLTQRADTWDITDVSYDIPTGAIATLNTALHRIDCVYRLTATVPVQRVRA